MTKDPVCTLPDASVLEVARLMKAQDIGPVPVVESQTDRRLVGIVTDRDLALNVVAEGRDPKTTRVADVMTRDVVTCRESDNVNKALDAMSNKQLRRIPVVDPQDRIVGIIAQADVATRVDEPKKTAEVVKDISK
ncbi:MAG: CBS domain-containing protein [Bacteroidota bacterium]